MVLIDTDYFTKEGKTDRKGEGDNEVRGVDLVCDRGCGSVFAQVLTGFRYGRDDLDVLGLNFRRDLVDVSYCLCSLNGAHSWEMQALPGTTHPHFHHFDM